MDKNEIQERIIRVIEEHLEPDDKVTPASTFDELGADSLDNVEIAMAVEEEFNIEISDEEAHLSTTVGALIDLVSGKVSVQT